MSEPNSYSLSLWIQNDITNLQFLSLKIVMLNIATQRLPDYSIEEISDICEKYFQRTCEELRNAHANQKDSGTIPNFEITDEDSPYIKTFNRPELFIKNKIDAYNYKCFEIFCSLVLTKLNAKAEVTGSKEDGGIDFIAYNFPFGLIKIPSPKTSRLTVLGQAKHHKKELITESELRKFIGGAVREHYKKLILNQDIKVLSPVVFAFWTNAEFHPAAIEYADNVGIWYLNGTALAQLAYAVGITDKDLDIKSD